MKLNGTERIKPIETIYNGYRFRSRLEARWAVFFDSLNVEYEYEPEGYDLGERRYYLPDFRVQCYGKRGDKKLTPFELWIEVKGEMTERDAEKIYLFAGHYDNRIYMGKYIIDNPVLIVGGIPKKGMAFDAYSIHAYERMNGINIFPFNYYTIDGDNYAAYPTADKEGRFYLTGSDYFNSKEMEITENAYREARQARFEHLNALMEDV